VIMKKFLVSILLIFTFASAQAQIEEELLYLIQLTLTTENEPSKQTYDDFWKKIEEQGSRSEIDKFLTLVDGLFLTAMELQKESWLSVKLSYENGMVVKTQRLIELETEVLAKAKKDARDVMTDAEFREFITAFNEESIRENSRRLLVGAADKTEIETTDGQVIQLSPAFISQILSSVEPGFVRLKELLTRRN